MGKIRVGCRADQQTARELAVFFRVPTKPWSRAAARALELGGADGLGNIWPECGPDFVTLQNRYFKIKDRVENYLADEVKSGRMPLDGAQRGIASDWTQYISVIRPGSLLKNRAVAYELRSRFTVNGVRLRYEKQKRSSGHGNLGILLDHLPASGGIFLTGSFPLLLRGRIWFFRCFRHDQTESFLMNSH